MTERTDSVATAPADVPALQVTDLLKHYADADRNVFDGISFSVPKGKVLVIVGPSGSGKSTLLRAIAGLEPIQGGESLLLNFAAGSVFHTSWQAGVSTYIAAESPVGQVLLLSCV